MYLLYIGRQQRHTILLAFKILVIINPSDSETELLLSELMNLNIFFSSTIPTMYYKDYYNDLT